MKKQPSLMSLSRSITPGGQFGQPQLVGRAGNEPRNVLFPIKSLSKTPLVNDRSLWADSPRDVIPEPVSKNGNPVPSAS